MVGPSITDDERERSIGRLKIGIVVLVGVSGGLIAVQSDASLPVVAGAVAGGLLLGVVLTWYLFRLARQARLGSRRPRG